MAIRLFCDEHVDHDLAPALWHREPAFQVLYVGGEGVPPHRTPDLELIRFAEREQFSLLTMDRNTLLGDVSKHWAAGGHTWGVFVIDPWASWGKLIDDLLLIWSASAPEDWRDRIEFIPW